MFGDGLSERGTGDLERHLMRILLVIILAPFFLIPLAAIGLQVVACDLHVTAVDGMRDKQASTERQGWFYGYCSLMAANLRRLG
jgi:hypothetical protein